MATIGDSGAPSTNTVYYDALLTTTLAAYSKTLVDNIFKESAFLAYLREAGAVDKQNGGERIAIPLLYGDNDTIKTHGGYSIIDTTPQEGLTTAFYEWAEIAGTISISRKEERQNSGEGRLINLLQAKIRQAEMSMTEKLNNDLVLGKVSGATFVQDTARDGAYGLAPLGYFLSKSNSTVPTTINVGNISRNTYTWWRHNTADISGNSGGATFNNTTSTFKGVKISLYRMYNYCARGSGGAPDLVVLDQVSYETYNNALDQAVQYQNTKMADMGFDTIKLRGATCIWDQIVPDLYTGTASTATYGSAFFLNTKFYRLVIDSETDIITTPFIEPENQTTRTARILFMGNATSSNQRKHGAVMGISPSIVS